MANPLKSSLEHAVRKDLAAIAVPSSPSTDDAIEAIDGALCVYGDALRLGIEAPRALRAWASGCAPSVLDGALQRAGAALAAVAAVGEAAASVAARDRAESVLVGVRRAWIPRPLAQLDAYAALQAQVDAVDAAMATTLTRLDLAKMLGDRAAFRPDYLARYPAPAARSATDLSSLLREELPSPDLEARYLEVGTFAKTIEAIASENPAFADGLEAAIDAMRGAEDVGLAARRWQKTRRGLATVAVSGPRLKYAAASEPTATPVQHHLLGRVEGLEHAIEVSLEISAVEVTLHVDISPGSVAEVRFGSDAIAPAPDATSVRLTGPRTDAPIVFIARDHRGQEIVETFAVSDG